MKSVEGRVQNGHPDPQIPRTAKLEMLARPHPLPRDRENLLQLVSESAIGVFECNHQNRNFRLQYYAAAEDGRTPKCIVPSQTSEQNREKAGYFRSVLKGVAGRPSLFHRFTSGVLTQP